MSSPLENPIARRVVLAVPPGIEVACVKIARRELGLKFERLSRGFIVAKKDQAPDRLNRILDACPLWTFGSFTLIAGFSNDIPCPDDAVARLAGEIAASGFRPSAYWLSCPPTEPRAAQALKERILRGDIGLPNDPTNYGLTLRIHAGDSRTYVMLGNSISVKDRFSYRKKDVGASINPVLAACLARLLPSKLDVRAVDPTCGSGTLLFERLRYSSEPAGLGIDISRTAEAAFQENHANCDHLSARIAFHRGSSADPKAWPPCSTVIANLPFGIRIKAKPQDLEQLYARILFNALSTLTPDGRILLASSFKRGLEVAVRQAGRDVRVLSKYKVDMGGLVYQVLVAARADGG